MIQITGAVDDRYRPPSCTLHCDHLHIYIKYECTFHGSVKMFENIVAMGDGKWSQSLICE